MHSCHDGTDVRFVLAPPEPEETRPNDEEEIWAGFGRGRRVTVEEVEDEDDMRASGHAPDDDEDGSFEVRAEQDEDDEFDPISVWDELSEALFCAAGSTGACQHCPYHLVILITAFIYQSS